MPALVISLVLPKTRIFAAKHIGIGLIMRELLHRLNLQYFFRIGGFGNGSGFPHFGSAGSHHFGR